MVKQSLQPICVFLISICTMLRSSKTDILPLSELSLNIDRPKTCALVFCSTLQSIQLRADMDVEYNSLIDRNATTNNQKRWNLMYWWQTQESSGPNTSMLNLQRSIISCFSSQIHRLRRLSGIFLLALIQSAIIMDLNFTMSLIVSPTTFSSYLKLF